MSSYDALDFFAGPGGWDEAAAHSSTCLRSWPLRLPHREHRGHLLEGDVERREVPDPRAHHEREPYVTVGDALGWTPEMTRDPARINDQSGTPFE